MSFGDHERMDLPDASVVHRLPADPAHHVVFIDECDATDFFGLETLDHGAAGGIEILPIPAAISERRMQENPPLAGPAGAVRRPLGHAARRGTTHGSGPRRSDSADS